LIVLGPGAAVERAIGSAIRREGNDRQDDSLVLSLVERGRAGTHSLFFFTYLQTPGALSPIHTRTATLYVSLPDVVGLGYDVTFAKNRMS
jgi:hypothetical protein